MKVLPIVMIAAVLVSAGGIGAYAAIDMQSHEYSITYVLDGGVNGDNPDKYNNTVNVILNDAYKEGYSFDGWYLDEGLTQQILFLHNNGDVTLYAKWSINDYTLLIHYIYENQEKAADDYTAKVPYNSKYSVNSPAITCYTPDKSTVSGTMGADNVTVTVTYSPTVGHITYVLDGGTNSPDNPETITVLDGEIVLNDPTKEYYTFDGWYLDEEFTEPVTSITYAGSDITLYAKWTAISEAVTYILNGGTNSPDNPASFTVETPVILADPTKTGYSFLGWFADEEFEEQVEILTFESGIRTVYAKWTVNSYTLTIHYILENDEKAADDYVAEVNFGEDYSVDSPEIPYFTPDSSTVYGTMEVGGVTETVIYFADAGYVTYELDGGTNSPDNPDSITALDGEVMLNDPSKKDYEFIGWYLDKYFTEEVTSITYEGSDITLYAYWIQNAYTITYILNGGTNSPDNPDTIQEYDTVELDAPTKEGYHFIMWIDEYDDEITEIYGLCDITVTALWIKDIANTIVSYSISGTYTEYLFFVYPVTSDIRGLNEFRFLDFDEEMGYRYYFQQYLRIGDDESYDSKIGWTGCPGPFMTYYVGIDSIDTVFGEKTCFVMKTENCVTTEYRYYGFDDGIEYRIDSETDRCITSTKMTYDLCGYADIDREETYTVAVYDGVGITTTGGGQINVYSELTLTATAGEMTTFKGWYDASGNLISKSSVLYFEMLMSDVTLYALNDEYFDVFTKDPELSMNITEITGIDDLSDISWILRDGDLRTLGDGDSVSVTLSEYGPKALAYSGTDIYGETRSGFVLIWYEDIITVKFSIELCDTSYTYILNLRHLNNPYYETMYIPRMDSTQDAVQFVTCGNVYILDVTKCCKIGQNLKVVDYTQYALEFAQRVPYITESDIEREMNYWISFLKDLGDCECCLECIPILYGGLIKIAEYERTMLFMEGRLATGVGIHCTVKYSFEACDDVYLCYDTSGFNLVAGKLPKDMILKNLLPVA